MKVYYLPSGEVHTAVYDADIFRTYEEPTAQTITVDEVPENKALCRDLASYSAMRDAEGLGRWFVEYGELFEREDWTPLLP